MAAIIKDGLKEVAAEQGEFSESGYSGYGEPVKDEVIYYGAQKQEKFTDKIKNLGTSGWILILILAIFALPILGPLGVGLLSAISGILIAAVVVLFVLVIVGIALLVAGASVFAAAIGCLFVTPAVGIMMLGLSLLLIGIGILATVLGIWIVQKVIPPVIRWIVKLFRSHLKRWRCSQ